MVYITSADHNIYAFSQNTAHRYWRKPTGSHVKSSPAVANGLVYLGSDDGKLYAYNLDGHPLSITTVGSGAPVDSSPTVTNGIVYIGSMGDGVYAYHLPGTSH